MRNFDRKLKDFNIFLRKNHKIKISRTNSGVKCEILAKVGNFGKCKVWKMIENSKIKNTYEQCRNRKA